MTNKDDIMKRINDVKGIFNPVKAFEKITNRKVK